MDERVKVFDTKVEAEQAAAELRTHGWPDAHIESYWLSHGQWVVECNEAQYLRQTGRVR